MFKKNSYFYYAAANALFYFSWAMFASMITVYLAGESLSTSQISLVTSASSLFAIVTQPICGLIADKIQSPKIVSIGCGVLAICTGIAFASTHAFFLLFLFNGLTQGFLNGLVILTDRLATACPYGYGSIRLWGSVAYAIGAQVSGMIYEMLFPQAHYLSLHLVCSPCFSACIRCVTRKQACLKKRKSRRRRSSNTSSPIKPFSILC